MSAVRRLRLSAIETRHLAFLAAPILGAQLAQMGMGTLDIAMSGHVDAATLAAVSVGSSIWLPGMIFIIGTLMGLTPIVAQHVGARELAAVRPALHQALWCALVLGVAIALIVARVGAWLMGLLDVPVEVAGLARRYLEAVALGLPAVAGYETLRFYSDGIGHTRASLLFAVLGLAVNGLANAVLIFGGPGLVSLFGARLAGPLAGLPALGAVGCGLATAIAMWTMLIGILIYTRIARPYAATRVGPAFSRPSAVLIGEQLRIGLPIGVAIFSEVVLFTAITLFLARYGEIVVAAHTVALNFSALMFMLPLSLGLALTVRVGQARGRGKYRQARFIAYNGLAIGLLMALLIDAILIFGGPFAVRLYSDNPAVQALAVNLLLVATIYQFSDAAQAALAGALRGYKDTRIVMWITLFAYWLVGLGSGHLLGDWLGSRSPALAVYGYWIGLIAGLSTAAALLAWRLHRTSTGPRVRAISV